MPRRRKGQGGDVLVPQPNDSMAVRAWGGPKPGGDLSPELGPPLLMVERCAYDKELGQKLVAHAKPVAMAFAVSIFRARARHARELVAERKLQLGGCESTLPHRATEDCDGVHEMAVRYIPVKHGELQILFPLSRGRFRADKVQLGPSAALSTSLLYRLSQRLDDKDGFLPGLPWGSTVVGKLASPNWLRVEVPLDQASPTRAEFEKRATLQRQRTSERIIEGEKLLMRRCEVAGVRVRRVLDDGNCQFRALAHELFGDQELHGHVRRRVVEQLGSKAEEYSLYVGDGDDWTFYLESMSHSSCWGDELTLRAAAEVYGCSIHVMSSENENWFLHYGSSPISNDGKGDPDVVRELFLAYVSPIHYNVVELIS